MPAVVITVVGRLTKDLEQASPNQPFKSAVAVDGLVKDGSEYKTKFFNINVWPAKDNGRGGTKASDLVAAMGAKDKVLTKGSMVMIIGTPTYELYKDKETGENRTSEVINVERIDFIPIGSSSSNENKSSEVTQSGTNQASNSGSLQLDDDIPLL